MNLEIDFKSRQLLAWKNPWLWLLRQGQDRLSLGWHRLRPQNLRSRQSQLHFYLQFNNQINLSFKNCIGLPRFLGNSRPLSTIWASDWPYERCFMALRKSVFLALWRAQGFRTHCDDGLFICFSKTRRSFRRLIGLIKGVSNSRFSKFSARFDVVFMLKIAKTSFAPWQEGLGGISKNDQMLRVVPIVNQEEDYPLQWHII